MGLVTIFFNSDNEYGYIKAIVREEDVEFFERFGQVYRDAKEVPDSIPTLFSPDIDSENTLGEILPDLSFVDGKKGPGVPGTLEWHESFITSFTKKDEILDYTLKVAGQTIPVAGTLTTVKQRALKVIKERIDNDNQSK